MSSDVTRQKKRLLPIMMVLGLGLVIVIVLVGLIHRNIEISLRNGGFIRITPASLWSSLGSGASCKIFYQPDDGRAGTVVLWQDLADKPVIVMLAADKKALLCLYNFDVDLRLLKIDPTQNPKPFPSQSRLGTIVYSSPWCVESGKTNDWQAMLDYLNELPPGAFKRQVIPAYDLGVVRFGIGAEARENLVRQIEEQIKVMRQLGGVEWPVPGR